jgi:hypothetical protein
MQHASAKRRLTLPDRPASSDSTINTRRRYANLFNGYLGISKPVNNSDDYQRQYNPSFVGCATESKHLQRQ